MLNYNSLIFVKMPFNYAINSNMNFNLNCKINGIRVDCFLEKNLRNMIRISGIPKQTLNSFTLIIAGVRLPKYHPAAAFSFKILFDINSQSDYEEGIANSIPDDSMITNSVSTNPLVVNSIINDNTVLDRLSTYTFYLSMNETLISKDTEFQVDFPSIWKITNVILIIFFI